MFNFLVKEFPAGFNHPGILNYYYLKFSNFLATFVINYYVEKVKKFQSSNASYSEKNPSPPP